MTPNASDAWILPNWPAPTTVHAMCTTRKGGVSQGPFAGLNLGAHVGDNLESVQQNRNWLGAQINASIQWLHQTHSTQIEQLESVSTEPLDADAAWTKQPYLACTVMTADCLPILICNQEGTQVAAIHAGWRGLLNGIIEASVAALMKGAHPLSHHEWLVWLGPAIGPNHFEVGQDVYDAFTQRDNGSTSAFRISSTKGKFLANLYELAKQRFQRIGIQHLYGGEYCTYSDPTHWYSYRRDHSTGRMASLIWLSPQNL